MPEPTEPEREDTKADLDEIVATAEEVRGQVNTLGLRWAATAALLNAAKEDLATERAAREEAERQRDEAADMIAARDDTIQALTDEVAISDRKRRTAERRVEELTAAVSAGRGVMVGPYAEAEQQRERGNTLTLELADATEQVTRLEAELKQREERIGKLEAAGKCRVVGKFPGAYTVLSEGDVCCFGESTVRYVPIGWAEEWRKKATELRGIAQKRDQKIVELESALESASKPDADELHLKIRELTTAASTWEQCARNASVEISSLRQQLEAATEANHQAAREVADWARKCGELEAADGKAARWEDLPDIRDYPSPNGFRDTVKLLPNGIHVVAAGPAIDWRNRAISETYRADSLTATLAERERELAKLRESRAPIWQDETRRLVEQKATIESERDDARRELGRLRGEFERCAAILLDVKRRRSECMGIDIARYEILHGIELDLERALRTPPPADDKATQGPWPAAEYRHPLGDKVLYDRPVPPAPSESAPPRLARIEVGLAEYHIAFPRWTEDIERTLRSIARRVHALEEQSNATADRLDPEGRKS